MTKGQGEPARMGLTFHRTFCLRRPALCQVLCAARDALRDGLPRPTGDDQLRRATQLGVEQIPSVRRYAIATRLLAERSLTLTAFAEAAMQHDPSLSSVATQWLMHYHLSAPQGPGPLFWNALVASVLRPGRTLSRVDVAQELAEILRQQNQQAPKPRALNSTATVFLGTYAKSDGLAGLRVLERQNNEYRVLQPEPPPLWVFAYALADYWQYRWPGQLTANLDELSGQQGLGSLFWMDSATLNQHLGRLKQAGVVDLYRVAPPYQVVRLWPDTHCFLRRAYVRCAEEGD